LIRFGTTTESNAMLPQGSPSAWPAPSAKFQSKPPVRPPVVTILNHPVAVMFVPGRPSGITMLFTSTCSADVISPIPSSTSIRVRFPSFFEKTINGEYHAVP